MPTSWCLCGTCAHHSQRAYDPNNPAAGVPLDELDESKLRLWNPISGVCTHIKDATCEMRQVGRWVGARCEGGHQLRSDELWARLVCDRE